MVKASILIPVKNNGATLGLLLDAIEAQAGDVPRETIVIDSGSSDGSLAIARRPTVRLEQIPPESFHHGATRNLAARLGGGERLLFVSADAVPATRRWLAELVRETDDPTVAGAYSRQIPMPAASPLEQYFLGYLYGPQRRVQAFGGDGWLDMSTTLFSNVSSCLRREAWERFPFDETSIMSEDQVWSRQALLAGYRLVYAPAAAVYHSHRYSLAGAFRRFFDSGASSQTSYMPGGARGTLRLLQEGAGYLRGEVAYLRAGGEGSLVPYALAYEAAKFAGLLAGRQRQHLPDRFARRLSYYSRPIR